MAILMPGKTRPGKWRSMFQQSIPGSQLDIVKRSAGLTMGLKPYFSFFSAGAPRENEFAQNT